MITTTAAALMVDHPAWLPVDEPDTCRAVRCGESVWSLTCVVTPDASQLAMTQIRGGGRAPTVDVFDPATLTGDGPVVSALREAGPVARVGNPDLWDALATAIIRQVIRAGQARKLYRTFCRRHGEQIAGSCWLMPTPQVVLDLPDEEFARLGMAFKRRPLQAAAEAYLQSGATWASLPPAVLLTELQQVPHVGPWTAGAAVADLSNDFSLYPFADLAVRTWAARLVPDLPWPDTEDEFAAVWQAQAGSQLSAWTLLTLAFGVRHASRTGAASL